MLKPRIRLAPNFIGERYMAFVPGLRHSGKGHYVGFGDTPKEAYDELFVWLKFYKKIHLVEKKYGKSA